MTAGVGRISRLRQIREFADEKLVRSAKSGGQRFEGFFALVGDHQDPRVEERKAVCQNVVALVVVQHARCRAEFYRGQGDQQRFGSVLCQHSDDVSAVDSSTTENVRVAVHQFVGFRVTGRVALEPDERARRVRVRGLLEDQPDRFLGRRLTGEPGGPPRQDRHLGDHRRQFCRQIEQADGRTGFRTHGSP